MTFTYTQPFNDVARVRFHLGDTDSTNARFTDEEITAIITEQGSWQKAVIACLENLIARLSSTPDFRADWLQVSIGSALSGYDSLLKTKWREFGITRITADAVHPYRPDSGQNGPPDFTQVQSEYGVE
jgi:hypothetical protein